MSQLPTFEYRSRSVPRSRHTNGLGPGTSAGRRTDRPLRLTLVLSLLPITLEDQPAEAERPQEIPFDENSANAWNPSKKPR